MLNPLALADFLTNIEGGKDMYSPVHRWMPSSDRSSQMAQCESTSFGHQARQCPSTQYDSDVFLTGLKSTLGIIVDAAIVDGAYID